MTTHADSEPVVLVRVDAGVMLITLNRPERNNGWTIEMEESYFDALAAAANDADVRVIVVTGAGRAFCPGLDINVLSAATDGTRMADRPRRPMNFPLSIPKPIIAAINGACAGIGFIQASCADLRFAAAGAKLTTSFARRGLPAENSLSWILPRIVGTANAMDLLLSGRVVLAEEAKKLGFVNRVVEPDELLPVTMAYAHDLAANCSPRAMATIKRQVLDDWEASLDQSRRRALELVVALEESGSDFKEGVASFREKRPPNFQGLAVVVDDNREWAR